MTYRRGMTVRTQHGTGPYRVLEVLGPCTCPAYLDELNAHRRDAAGQWIYVPPPQSRPHWHLTARADGDVLDSYLNGYDSDGKSVWGLGWLEEVGFQAPEPVQLELI